MTNTVLRLFTPELEAGRSCVRMRGDEDETEIFSYPRAIIL